MRHLGIVSLALSAALLSFGCGASNSSNASSDPKIKDAKDKIDDAAKATAEAAKAKRDEYAREMAKRLDDFDAKCKELEGRITKAEGQTKKDLEKKLEEAKAKRGAASKKLDELRDASADRWEKVKEGAGKALDDLKKTFE
jgi:TolA-binding protein